MIIPRGFVRYYLDNMLIINRSYVLLFLLLVFVSLRALFYFCLKFDIIKS